MSGSGVLLSALLMGIVTTSAQETVTLRVWDTFTEASDNAGMEKMIAAFEAANPNIKIERDTMVTDDMRPILRTALASGTGPDMMYYDTGPGFAGVLAEAEACSCRWTMPISRRAGMIRIFEWTKARTTFGDQSLWHRQRTRIPGRILQHGHFQRTRTGSTHDLRGVPGRMCQAERRRATSH